MARRIMKINFRKKGEEYNSSLNGLLKTEEDNTYQNFYAHKFDYEYKSNSTYDGMQYLYDLAFALSYGGDENKAPGHFMAVYNDLKKKSRRAFYKTFDTVKLSGGYLEDCVEFIKNHKRFFKKKAVIIPGTYKLNEESLDELLTVYDSIKNVLPKNKLEINVEDCDLTYSLDEYMQAYEQVESIVNEIKSLDLSPLEQVAFAYDALKKRVFKDVDAGGDLYKSRDLVSSLIYEDIVCVGFTRAFKAILTNLGFYVTENFLVHDKNKEAGQHVRNIVYIDDPKYMVLGHYFFDITSDSKRYKEDDNAHSYESFLRTLEEIYNFDDYSDLKMRDEVFLARDFDEKLENELPDIYSLKDLEKLCNPKKIMEFFNNLEFGKIEIKNEGNSKKELISALKDIMSSFNVPIELDALIELFYTIRKVEYYLNPDEVPFSTDDIKKSIKLNRYNTGDIDNRTYKKLTKKKNFDFGEYFEGEREKLFERTLSEEKEREIAAVKLTRTLRSHLINNQAHK